MEVILKKDQIIDIMKAKIVIKKNEIGQLGELKFLISHKVLAEDFTDSNSLVELEVDRPEDLFYIGEKLGIERQYRYSNNAINLL